jgi:DNA-binding response OmpR family regulator
MILSARTQEGDQKLANEMGANRFMTKPYEFAEILEHIKALLKQSAAARP